VEVFLDMATARKVPTLDMLRGQRNAILAVASRCGASNVRVFGSVARGDAIESSDVDLLVDMQRDLGGFEYFGRLEDLRRDLTELLQIPVDVVDAHGLRRLRNRIFAEAVPL
jgi:predicted nucleotidyltransferase